jgi:hypothetical protein
MIGAYKMNRGTIGESGTSTLSYLNLDYCIDLVDTLKQSDNEEEFLSDDEFPF